jgi:hypothetical protein
MVGPRLASAQGTALTYQGRLDQNGTPANGMYDLAFVLFGTNTGGTAVAPPQTNNAVPVDNGLFTVALDFGPNFPGADRWLEISARTNSTGDFVTLSPRQKLTATPYAVTARTVTGVVPTAGLAGTYGSAVTFNNAGNSFTGSGAGLTGVNATSLGGLNANQFWKTTGNGGTTPANFLGSTDNQPVEMRVNGGRALRLQPGSNGVPSVAAGGVSNLVSAGTPGASIAGGNFNFIESFPAAGSDFAAIGGGSSNQIGYFSFNAVIGGGLQNTLEPNDYYSTIAGGLQNRMGFHAVHSTISGGRSNHIDVSVDTSTISGGADNAVGFLAHYATIGAGRNNLILSNAEYSVISGGRENAIEFGAAYAHVGGGERNRIHGGWHNTISGGGANAISAESGTIGGGTSNGIETNSYEATIGGGSGNVIHTNAERATIAGGVFHEVEPGASYSFIGGGTRNKAGTNSQHATISGGSNNEIDHDTSYCSIGGGKLHIVSPNSAHATIAGGDGNTAGGEAPAIGGGTLNVIEPGTTYSTITGGGGNRVGAGSFGTTIAGGYLNQAVGNFSFAAGNRAQAVHPNTFAWAGGNTLPYASIFPNSFNIYSSNGVSMDYGPQSAAAPRGARYVYIGPFNSGLTLSAWNGARLTDGGIWSNASDRNRKTDFHGINPREVLEKVVHLPVSQWRYTNEDAGVKHLGPVAQDFQSAFGLGTDDKSIGTVDADGVALAAIQGLNQKLQEELKRRDAENAELKERLSRLERLLSKER